ncbi:MAG: ABC transporter ATP-binding protein [Elusimicrobia bacterium]|jgi:cobalt/nickel transport system ATP-binding protein|nr:ABC transporter ATP-binding protein [Elusimicrobiota bacterium]
MTVPVIRLSQVGYSYPGGAKIFDKVNFSLGTNERVGLSGPVGAGKSTLLHLMVGLLGRFSGTVEVFGHECHKEKDFQKIRGSVGLLFQDPDDQLFCPSVEEEVAFGPLNQGRSRFEVGQIVKETLAQMGLVGYEEREPRRLSGGEKRLVSLAAVLAMSPRVLLLDEPTAGLDDSARQRLLALLGGLPMEMVIASHDRDFLQTLTTRSFDFCRSTE